MIFQGIVAKLNRVEYAMDAVDNVHMGEECPDEDHPCDKCAEKIIAVWDRISELPRFYRVLLWVCCPRSTWEFKKEVEFLRERESSGAALDAD